MSATVNITVLKPEEEFWDDETLWDDGTGWSEGTLIRKAPLTAENDNEAEEAARSPSALLSSRPLARS